MREGIGIEHPLPVIRRSLLNLRIGGEGLHRGLRDGAGREPLVEVNALTCGLAQRVEPGGIHEFEK